MQIKKTNWRGFLLGFEYVQCYSLYQVPSYLDDCAVKVFLSAAEGSIFRAFETPSLQLIGNTLNIPHLVAPGLLAPRWADRRQSDSKEF